jgi:3-phosphoshikimate 1-carboxyvinyltransferase
LIARVRGARRVQGEVTLPGDKSISHRALIFSAIADGTSHLRGLSSGEDVESTASCLRQLGVSIDSDQVVGAGVDGLRESSRPLQCGNSGTTMRLLAGLLAAQPFASTLIGDASLSRRPMDRVVGPLRDMGADAQWPPLRVGGRVPLKGIELRQSVPSAQVKSAVLLAGLYADGTTAVLEPVLTRNHTELMLQAMGANLSVRARRVEVTKTERLDPIELDVPGDVSSASFWLVAAALLPGSRVRMPGAGVNPTRTAFVDLWRASGAKVSLAGARWVAGEPVADLECGGAGELRPMSVGGAKAAEMIDELPALAVAATQLPGTSTITGAAELRVKESDRIAGMAQALAAMGADITATDEGWVITGPRRLQGARVRSQNDHRLAMALAVAGLLADGQTEIEDAECVNISYPGFFDQLESLCSPS